MDRRTILKGLIAAPVVTAVGQGNEWGLITNVKMTPYAVYDVAPPGFKPVPYIYFEPIDNEWTMTLHNLEPGDYVHIHSRSDHGLPCIFSHRTLRGAEVKLPSEFKVSAKVGVQNYKNVSMFNCHKVKVMS